MLKRFRDWVHRYPNLYCPLMYVWRKLASCIPAGLYIKCKYARVLGKKLNLDEPKTYNEKIQYLKLYWRDSLAICCSDKLRVREYVSAKIGKKYLNKLIAVYDSPNDVKWESLPSKFVVKLSHDSGSVIICKDKTNFDIKATVQRFAWRIRINFGKLVKEWVYASIPPKVLVEKYLGEVKDYKVFCFDGVPRLIQVDVDRFKNHRRNFYTTNWDFLNFSVLYPNDSNALEPKPSCLDEMLRCSSILSKPFPHVRVDWYIKDNALIFGEMTFFHGSGYEVFSNEEWAIKMGDWLELPSKSYIP